MSLEAKLEKGGPKISNIKKDLNKALDFSQNVSKHWVYGGLEQKRRIQNFMFPNGLVIDTEKRQYLTLKTNALFVLNRSFSKDNVCKTEDSPSKNDEESSAVAEPYEISNHTLINDISEVVDFINQSIDS